MNNYIYTPYVSPASELYHHGIKGQKWGVRRYQNEDGSLTAAGRQRYGVGEAIKNVGRKLFGPTKVSRAVRADESEQLAARKDKSKEIAQAKQNRKEALKNAEKNAERKYEVETDKAWNKYADRITNANRHYKDLSAKDITAHAVKSLAAASVPTLAGMAIVAKGKSTAAAVAGLSLATIGVTMAGIGASQVGSAVGGKLAYNMLHPKKKR